MGQRKKSHRKRRALAELLRHSARIAAVLAGRGACLSKKKKLKNKKLVLLPPNARIAGVRAEMACPPNTKKNLKDAIAEDEFSYFKRMSQKPIYKE